MTIKAVIAWRKRSSRLDENAVADWTNMKPQIGRKRSRRFDKNLQADLMQMQS
jgi:hypothetical protein